LLQQFLSLHIIEFYVVLNSNIALYIHVSFSYVLLFCRVYVYIDICTVKCSYVAYVRMIMFWDQGCIKKSTQGVTAFVLAVFRGPQFAGSEKVFMCYVELHLVVSNRHAANSRNEYKVILPCVEPSSVWELVALWAIFFIANLPPFALSVVLSSLLLFPINVRNHTVVTYLHDCVTSVVCHVRGDVS